MPTFNLDTILAARRLLGAKPLGNLARVMASPPTITNPASTGAPSTVIPASTIASGKFSPADANRIKVHGGPLGAFSASAGWRIETLTRVAGQRFQGHSAGISFWTDAAVIDFGLRTNGARWTAMITDPDGVRSRIGAADQVEAFPGLNYYKMDFGSTAGGGRKVELYLGQGSNFGFVNTPDGYSIWPGDQQDEPKVAVIWDSFGEGRMNDPTLELKLATADWFAAVFGCTIPHVNAIASTGVIATAGGNNFFTFGQRVAAGDMDASRVGYFDLIFAPGSVNDSLSANGGQASPGGDATVQEAYRAYIAALMVAQPRAIILGCGGEYTPGNAAVATRTAAYAAGFAAAKAAAPQDQDKERMLWMSNSPFELAPDTGVLGADNVHVGGIFGARHTGERLARRGKALIESLM